MFTQIKKELTKETHKNGCHLTYADRKFRIDTSDSIHEYLTAENAYLFYCNKNGRTSKEALVDNLMIELYAPEDEEEEYNDF